MQLQELNKAYRSADDQAVEGGVLSCEDEE